jgi:hypothetical protein
MGEAGRMELHLETFPLVPLIEDMAKMIEPTGVHARKILKVPRRPICRSSFRPIERMGRALFDDSVA